MRVLFATADTLVGKRVAGWLHDERIAIDVIEFINDCANLCHRTSYDLVLYDLKLGQEAGLRALRDAGCSLPVIAVEDHGTPASRSRALDGGADDCISRPLDRCELVSRITALVRRAYSLSNSMVRVGDLEIDLRTHVARVNGTVLELSRRQYAILEVLALRKGRIVDRDTIRNHLYGPLDWCASRTVDVYVHQLRSKIAKAGYDRRCLKTSRNLGLKLDDLRPVQLAGAA